MNEIWVNIGEGGGKYEVSNIGRVKSFQHTPIGRLLKPNDVKGYHRVVICDGVNQAQRMIHQLVAKAFIPNPENKPHINHKNGIRNDNSVQNLEWCTISENAIHSFRVLGHINPLKGRFGKDHPTYGKGVLIRPKRRVKCDNFDISFDSMGEAARELGVSHSHISLVCRGKALSAQGLSFRYI